MATDTQRIPIRAARLMRHLSPKSCHSNYTTVSDGDATPAIKKGVWSSLQTIGCQAKETRLSGEMLHKYHTRLQLFRRIALNSLITKQKFVSHWRATC